MTYPASDKTLDTWVADVDRQAMLVKSAAENQKTLSSAGTLNVDYVARFYNLLVETNNLFVAVAAVSGIAQYVKDQKGDQTLNPVTEFQAMATEVVSVLGTIRTLLPNDTFPPTIWRSLCSVAG